METHDGVAGTVVWLRTSSCGGSLGRPREQTSRPSFALTPPRCRPGSSKQPQPASVRLRTAREQRGWKKRACWRGRRFQAALSLIPRVPFNSFYLPCPFSVLASAATLINIRNARKHFEKLERVDGPKHSLLMR